MKKIWKNFWSVPLLIPLLIVAAISFLIYMFLWPKKQKEAPNRGDHYLPDSFLDALKRPFGGLNLVLKGKKEKEKKKKIKKLLPRLRTKLGRAVKHLDPRTVFVPDDD